MLRKYRDAIILILIGLIGAVNAVLAGIIPSALQDSWKPYLWLSWPLFGVFTALGLVLAIWQARNSDKAPPNHNLIQEQRNRQAMLKLVYNTWIEGVLKKSLYNEVLIDLGMETRPDAIEHPLNMSIQLMDQEPKPILPGTSMLDLFSQTNGALLILGEPGSGKTTMLLELAREAIDCAISDPIQPVPVVFNLSSWTPKLSIAEWIVEELRYKYYIPEKISQQWIEKDDLMLILDGLDEVEGKYRDECVQAINSCRSEHNMPLVICSRIQEYEALNSRLKLRGAVLIQPLTLQQINIYLRTVGTALMNLYQKLNQDPRLQKFVWTPLLLSILILTYRGRSSEDMNSLRISTDIRNSLFDDYIEKMFNRRTSTDRYPPEHTKKWLKWLAQKMAEQGQTIFYIENISTDWLHSSRKTKLWNFLRTLVIGLVMILVAWKLGILFSGGWLIAIGYMIISFSPEDRRPVEKFFWSWKQVSQNILLLLVTEAVIATVYGIFERSFESWPRLMSICMLVGIIWVGLSGSDKIEYRRTPGHGIRASLNNSLLSSFVAFLAILLSGTLIKDLFWGIMFGLSFAPLFGLIYGGYYLLNYFILRWMFFIENHTPWNYIQFLDYAADRIFLRKVGGGYIFIHRMLMEHFAEMDTNQPEGK